MRKVEFVQADVFSDSPFGGNPVVVVPQSGAMSSDDMQSLARGMNFGETAFVCDVDDASQVMNLRCFSPTVEMAYSGHSLLGAAFVAATDGLLPGIADAEKETVELSVFVGGQTHPVTLVLDGRQVSRVSTEAARPLMGDTLHDVGAIAAALSIDPMDVMQTGMPVQVVDTSLRAVIVPLGALEAVRSLQPVSQAIRELSDSTGAALVLTFSTDTLDPANDLHVRVFAPQLGLDEDPASGAANAALAAYLAHHKPMGGAVARLRSEQGTEMGRPSIVELEVSLGDQPPSVRFGGRVARSIEGCAYY